MEEDDDDEDISLDDLSDIVKLWIGPTLTIVF